MIHVLFVDDEIRILDGLRRLLRPMRNEWEMYFVQNGSAALKLLEEEEMDVVISDMKMPGMDGAELLHSISQRYPHIIRIILSGHSDKSMIYRALGATHIYLAKPSTREEIQDAILRTTQLRNLLNSDKLQSLVSKLDQIPTRPQSYYQLMDVVSSDDYSLQAVADVIRLDVGMTAKILQLVNSAFFGLPRQISDPLMAINLLGMEVLLALVMTLHMFNEYSFSPTAQQPLHRVWTHSQSTAFLAKQIAEYEHFPRRLTDDIFAAALLHDCGKLILIHNMPDEYEKVEHLISEQGLEEWEAEYQVFGATHAQMGAYLLGIWGLPIQIVEAVAYHHHVQDHPVKNMPILTLLTLADSAVHQGTNGNHPDPALLLESYQSRGCDFTMTGEMLFSMVNDVVSKSEADQ